MAEGTRRKVIASAEEARVAQKAEALLQAGSKNFEEVYGSKDPGSFNIGGDIEAMQEVGMMDDKQGKGVTDAQAQPQPAPVAPPVAPAPPEPPPVAQEPPVPSSGAELSDDPEKRLEQVVESLKKIHPNPPTVDMLKEWKRVHGDIFLLNIENHVFLYRYLKRQEWVQINANPRFEEMPEHQVEEMMFNRCVLWPILEPIQQAGLPAGTMTMVVQQVRIQSLFLDPAFVAQMTFKL